jgi:hypothetical protein
MPCPNSLLPTSKLGQTGRVLSIFEAGDDFVCV